MEVGGCIVSPEGFPETQDVQPGEFALVPDEQHAEEEEKVCGVDALEVQVEFWVEELDEVVEGSELEAHATLVAKEVAFLWEKWCQYRLVEVFGQSSLPCDS